MQTFDVRDHIQVFDPQAEYLVAERRLPHWAQSGTVCFLTWRTWDSMPQAVLDRWLAERNAWLVRHDIDPQSDRWKQQLLNLPKPQQNEFRQVISQRWEAHLDECHGECVLRRGELSSVVADSLRHFDSERYTLTDFVIMPNHVHVLAAFRDAEQMLRQCESWKHFTAMCLNRKLGRRGRFWAVDAFDHLVRNAEQFDHFRRYIAANPQRARLRQGEYVHYSRQLATM